VTGKQVCHKKLHYLQGSPDIVRINGVGVRGVVAGMGELWIRPSEIKSLREKSPWKIHMRVIPKRDRVTGGWRKLHNEELHNMYSSPNIIRIIKSRRMRWAGR
jgi:hypothetical protein